MWFSRAVLFVYSILFLSIVFLLDCFDLFVFYFHVFWFCFFFFFSSRRRHTRYIGDWSSDVCSSDLRARLRGRGLGGCILRLRDGRDGDRDREHASDRPPPRSGAKVIRGGTDRRRILRRPDEPGRVDVLPLARIHRAVSGLWRIAAPVIAGIIGLPLEAWTQQLEPRAYSPAPVGVNFAGAIYTHVTGGAPLDPSLPLKNTHVEVESPALFYVRTFDFLGRQASAGLLLPYAWESGSAGVLGQDRSARRSGPADPYFRLATNLIGG